MLALFVVDRLRRRCVPGRLLLTSGMQTELTLGRRRQRLTIDGRKLVMRRRWGTVSVRWVGGSDQGPVQVRTPEGDVQTLEFRGPGEPIYKGDSLAVGSQEYYYSAPVARPREPIAKEFDLEDRIDICGVE